PPTSPLFPYTTLFRSTAGDPHVNERIVGEALREVRSDVVIASKFGLRFDIESGVVPYPLIPDSRPETIRRSVEGSLKRLQTDHIDRKSTRLNSSHVSI